MNQEKKHKKENIGRSRSRQIKFFVNEKEWEALRYKVEKLKSTQSKVMRSLIMGEALVVKEGIVELSKEMRIIGKNINQLARIANTNGQVEEFEMLRKMNEALLELNKEILNKI